MKAMPMYLFARREKDRDGTDYLLAFENQAEAIEDDGPTTVTTYKRVKSIRLRKIVTLQDKSRK